MDRFYFGDASIPKVKTVKWESHLWTDDTELERF